MATIKASYGTEKQVIALTIDSLTASATVGRASTAVDNTVNLFLDALVFLKVPLANSTIGGTKACYVYAYGSVDVADSLYTENVTGSDAGFTIVNPTNLKLIGIISCPVTNATYYAGPFSVAAGFGGVLPEKWGLVFINDTGQALTTGALVYYQGVFVTTA